MFAGPFMNLILAVVLFAIVLMGIGVPTGRRPRSARSARASCRPPRPAEQCPRGRAADARPPRPGSGPGDRIVAFNGAAVRRARRPRAAGGDPGRLRHRDGRPWSAAASGSTSRPTLIDNRAPRTCRRRTRPCRPASSGSSPVRVYERQDLGRGRRPDRRHRRAHRARRIVELPSRVPGLFGAVFLGEERDHQRAGRHRRRLPDRRRDPRPRRAAPPPSCRSSCSCWPR